MLVEMILRMTPWLIFFAGGILQFGEVDGLDFDFVRSEENYASYFLPLADYFAAVRASVLCSERDACATHSSQIWLRKLRRRLRRLRRRRGPVRRIRR